MANVDPSAVDDTALQIINAVMSFESSLDECKNLSHEIKTAAERFNSYNGQRVEKSSRIEEYTIIDPNTLIPSVHRKLYWQVWDIDGQDNIIELSTYFDNQISSIEDCLVSLYSEGNSIASIAVKIDNYIKNLEEELGGTIDRNTSLVDVFAQVSLGQMYGTFQFGKIMKIPEYYQQNYDDVVLANGKYVSLSGCGFTSMSMALSYLLGQKITPRELVDDWARGYYVYNQGMDLSFPAAVIEKYGLGTVTETTDINQVVEALKNNHPVVSSQNAGLFTQGKHIILLNGVDKNNNIYVNDPNMDNAVLKDYNNRGFTTSEISQNAIKYFILPAKK